MEEPVRGKSGSIAINLALRSHLGPIHRRPCHLLGGRLRRRYQRPRRRQVSPPPAGSRQHAGSARQRTSRWRTIDYLAWTMCVCVCVRSQTCMLLPIGTPSICENTHRLSSRQRNLFYSVSANALHVCEKSGGKCSGFLYRVKCHRL